MITDRIDRITRIPPDAAPHMPAPRSVKVELCGRCNYRCGFCALQTRTRQPTKDMTLEFFQRVAGEMLAAGVEEVGLFYIGESFMNPKLLTAAVRYAKTIGFPYVFLTTNGSLARADVVEGLMAAGLDSLKFSINADGPEQFREVMAVNPALYERALANLRDARRVRDAGHYPCGLYASSIRFDGQQRERMEALVRERVLPYVDEHYWLPLYSMGAFAKDREAELGYTPIAGNQGRLGALRDPIPCWSVFTEGHITCSGKLSACCFDASGKWAMADLHEVSFMDGWNSIAFQDLRVAHLRGDVHGTICEACVAYT